MADVAGVIVIVAMFGVLLWLARLLGAVAARRSRAHEPVAGGPAGRAGSVIAGCIVVLMLWGWALPFAAPLILLWWLWSAVNKRLEASESVGVVLWGGFLLVASLILIPTTLCMAVLAAIKPAVGVVFLAVTLLLAVVTAALAIRHQLPWFAFAVALQATAAFPVLVVFIVIIYVFVTTPVSFVPG